MACHERFTCFYKLLSSDKLNLSIHYQWHFYPCTMLNSIWRIFAQQKIPPRARKQCLQSRFVCLSDSVVNYSVDSSPYCGLFRCRYHQSTSITLNRHPIFSRAPRLVSMENTFASKINYYFPTLLDSSFFSLFLLLKNSQHSTTVMQRRGRRVHSPSSTAQHICLFVMLKLGRDKQQVFFPLFALGGMQEDRVSHVWRRTRHNLNI